MYKRFSYGALAVLGSGTFVVGSYVYGARCAYDTFGKVSCSEVVKFWKTHKELKRREWWNQQRDRLENLRMKILGSSQN